MKEISICTHFGHNCEANELNQKHFQMTQLNAKNIQLLPLYPNNLNILCSLIKKWPMKVPRVFMSLLWKVLIWWCRHIGVLWKSLVTMNSINRNIYFPIMVSYNWRNGIFSIMKALVCTSSYYQEKIFFNFFFFVQKRIILKFTQFAYTWCIIHENIQYIDIL